MNSGALRRYLTKGKQNSQQPWSCNSMAMYDGTLHMSYPYEP